MWNGCIGDFTMSTLFVNNLNTASGTDITVPTGKKIVVTDEGGVRVPGSVIQVVHSRFTTPTVVAVDAFADTGLSATITPKSTSSKILVHGYLMGHGHNGSQEGHYFRLYRSIGGASDAHLTAASGVAAGSRIGIFAHMPGLSGDDEGMQTIPYEYLDTPSTTSAIVYKMYSRGYNSGSYYGYLNRSLQDIDRYHNARGVCSMTLMEIAQ